MIVRHRRQLVLILIAGLCPAVLWQSRPVPLSKEASPKQARRGWRRIGAGQTHTYVVTLRAGQFARVLLEQRDIDLSLGASFADGSVLPALSGSEYGYEAIDLIAHNTGPYLVRVTADADDSAKGSYRIWVGETRLAQTHDEEALQAHRLFAGVMENPAETPEGRARKITGVQRAAGLWHSAGDSLHEAQALDVLGQLFQRDDQIVSAEHSYDSARRIFERLGDVYGRVEALKLRANLGSYFGEDRGPLPVLKAYLDIWRKLGDRRGQAVMLSAIASCHGRKREYPLAIDYETRALNLREALGNQTDIADSLSALASFYVRTGNFSDAIACAKRALRIEREWGSQRGIGAALSTLATTLDMAGRSSETMPYLQESLTIKEAQGDRTAEIGTYLLMSSVNNKRGDPLAGLANLETARDLQDEVAGQIANPITSVDVRNSIAVYREYIWALMALHRKHPGYGYDRRAFLAADYERARYVTSVLQPSRLEDLASALDPNSVLIEYFIDSHSKGFIWLLTRARLVSLTFDRVSAVPELARAILQEMSRPGGGATPRSTARGELSRILLGPVAPYIKGMRLIIISDESFGFLPLGDLADPSREDGAPLIRDHQVAYLPAATVMVDTRNSRREVRTSRCKLMAVVADPIFERSDTRFKRRFHNYGEAVVQPKELTAATRSFGWTRDGTDYIPPLPFSRSEADAVTRTAPPGEVAEYLGFRASRTAVLRDLADYKIIHFATHGLINASAPELSGLLLSLWDPTGASQPGFLTISDIYDLGLQASLVTLSSCQTSLGQRISGYGVIGLTSAFLHAGARRVVSSSWKVDDEATAKLMTFFYRNLLTRRLDPADALRQAQLRLADSVRWRDPYYWAGWRLYGAQGPMRTEPTQPRR